jgi:hypothetical protein
MKHGSNTDGAYRPMTQIVLTPEQAAVLASTKEPIAVCGPDGSVAAIIRRQFFVPDPCPFSAEEIAAADKDSESSGPWYSTHEVVDHLHSLEHQ